MTVVGSWLNLSVRGFLDGCNWDGVESAIAPASPQIVDEIVSPIEAVSPISAPNTQQSSPAPVAPVRDLGQPVHQFLEGIAWDGSNSALGLEAGSGEIAPELQSTPMPLVHVEGSAPLTDDLVASNGHHVPRPSASLDVQSVSAIGGLNWLRASVGEFLAGCNWQGETRPEPIAPEPLLSPPETNLPATASPAASANGFVPVSSADLVERDQLATPAPATAPESNNLEAFSRADLQEKVSGFFQALPWDGSPVPIAERASELEAAPAVPKAQPIETLMAVPVAPAERKPDPIPNETLVGQAEQSAGWLSGAVQQFFGKLAWDGTASQSGEEPSRDRAIAATPTETEMPSVQAPALADSVLTNAEMGVQVQQFFQAVPWNGVAPVVASPQASKAKSEPALSNHAPTQSSNSENPINLAEMF